MHKKHPSIGHRDHHRHSFSLKRRDHLKSRKGTEESTLEITNVPQNSRNELVNKNLEYEVKEKFKSHKDKHKHIHREEVKQKDRKLHNVTDIQGLALEKEAARRKEKREKDRLNKIEKYLEGVNKENKKISRHRSLSLVNSEVILRHKERHIRREKTFQDKIKRDGTPYKKEPEIIATSKEKSDKKRKEQRKRESSKEINTKKDLEAIMYCQVEAQSPFKQGKKKLDIQRLYPKPSNKTSIIVTQAESAQKDKHKKRANLMCSPKAKIESRHYTEKCSDASLTNKYFVVGKDAQLEHESSHPRKKKHRKQDNENKVEKKGEARARSKSENTKRKQEKNRGQSDPYKVKIEDDIKSYFSKIQTLIDKKLDFILGNSASKETKSNGAEDKTDKRRRKKEKPKLLAQETSDPKRRKRNDASKTSEEERKGEKLHGEETRNKLSQAVRRSRRARERTASNFSIDTEVYPPEDPCKHRRRRSSKKRHDNNTEAAKHLKLSDSEGNDLKMKPERLIMMLEHPSSFSLSNNSLANEAAVQKVRQKPKEPAGNGVDCHRLRETRREIVEDGLQTKDPHQEALPKKYKHNHTVPVPEQYKPQLTQQRLIDVSKIAPDITYPALNVIQQENHRKRDNSVTRRNTVPVDETNVEDMEQKFLQDKKLKKRLRQLMNLECKTISIVGIPSQVRESTIFNETQTTTSLNVPLDDSVEQKKKSKRFKLYYKYSVADNKCPSDKSSDGMKTAVSDSYRVVSDPSDNNNDDVWEEDNDLSKGQDKGKDAEVTRYLFKMQRAKTKNHQIETGEHATKKYRKRVETIKPIALNNILEEPSNVSVIIRRNEVAHYAKKDVNCTYFNSLKSSSSDCIVGQKKQPVQKWNVPPYKHKHPNTENSLQEYCVRPGNSSKKSHVKSEIKSKANRKVRKMQSHERIQTSPKKNKIKHVSRSDIDISYDSLRQAKLNKEEQISNSSDYIKQQLKQILPELFTQNPGPIRDSLDMILKKELKEIVKEIPKNIHRKKFESILELGIKKDYNEKGSLKDTRTNSVEINTSQSLGDQKLCSKKAVLSQTGTRIPILIKGYVGTQVTSAELIETSTSNDQENQHEVLETVPVKQSEKTLVSVATEISIDHKRKEINEVTVEDKLSQTPETRPNVNRPSTNSENYHTRRHKSLESNKRRDRSNSTQSSRQKSSASEKISETFEPKKSENDRSSKMRPLTAQDTYSEMPKTPKFKRKATLTMSTNVVTINAPLAVERGTELVEETPVRDDVKTCVEETRTREVLGSNTALSLDFLDTGSRIGSLVCVDRQSNAQKTNFSSNSRSLDQYTAKSTISEHHRSGRLFLTKSFYPEMNTYQRRKVYDESIRRKMRKKLGTQSHIGSRVFEVRYLTLENGNLGEDFRKPPVINQTCFSKLPTFGTRINKGKQKTTVSVKRCRKNFPKNKEDACKYSGRDIFAPIITDVDQLNRFRRKSFPVKSVEEIFLKNEVKSTVQEEIGTSSVVDDNTKQSLEVLATRSEGVETPNFADPKQNFKSLIDSLYNSILAYCNTKFELPQAEKEKVESSLKVGENDPSLSNRTSYIISSKTSNESSQKNVSDADKLVRPVTNLIGSHMSCPVLAGSTSSFDYLYEDGPIDGNKETILLHIGKPLKTILGYAFNNTKPLNREPLRDSPRKVDQMSNCATQSEESGYSSNQSKKCASVCSFFKRPSIVSLFKPVNKLEACLPSTRSVSTCRSGPCLQQYNAMNQKCIEYAEKVRIQSQSNHEQEHIFQEIPLDVLLFYRKNSEFYDDFNSNCSLCQKRSLVDTEIGDEMSTEIDNGSLGTNGLTVKDNSELMEKEIHSETLIYYEDSAQRPSLEIVTFQKSPSNVSINSTPQITSEIVKCPVIISITNLNPCSLTVIEEAVSNNGSIDNFDAENVQKEQELNVPLQTPSSTGLIEVSSNQDLKSLASTDEDGKSYISSIFRCCTPSATKKYLAKRFFDNLLKVYEKEMNLSNILFRDDDFFASVLLEAENADISKSKGDSFKSFFKGKIKSMFSSKIETEAPKLHRDPVNNHQKRLQILASDARRYFSMYVEAVRINSGINDEVKICGLLKLLERIEDGDFAILRKKEDVDFEEEVKEQVRQAFVNTYNVSLKEAKKRKRCLTVDDLNLIRTFVSKYRIGLLSNTNLIATYIGRGIFKTENHLKAAISYLIQQSKNKDIDINDFDAHCKSLNCSE